MDNKKELLMKLKALADRGIDGEKIAAETQLKKLMKKYNISEEELADNVEKECLFELKQERDEMLFYQIVYAFFHNKPIYTRRYAKKFNRSMYLTAAEEIELRYIFSILLADYKKEENLFYTAFVNKNRIFPPKSEAGEGKKDTMRDSDNFRFSQYYNVINKSQIRPAIGDGK